MQKYLGLFLFLLVSTSHAADVLLLRGRVPASVNVEWSKEELRPMLRTNLGQKVVQPRVKTIKNDGFFLVSIIHP